MSNLFDSLLNNPALNDIKNKAQETLGQVSGSGAVESLKQNLGGNSLGGLLGAGALGGLLGALVTGKSVQKVAKGALVVGGTAAVGALAWQFYQKWAQPGTAQAGAPGSATQPGNALQGNIPATAPASQPATGQDANVKALLLVEAMVFAARADGHIDATEQSRIYETVAKLCPGQEPTTIIGDLLHKPLDPASIAAKVSTQEEGYDIYKLSCLIVDVDHFMERSYLDGLAASLHIPAEVKFRLEQEAEALKQQVYAANNG